MEAFVAAEGYSVGDTFASSRQDLPEKQQPVDIHFFSPHIHLPSMLLLATLLGFGHTPLDLYLGSKTAVTIIA